MVELAITRSPSSAEVWYRVFTLVRHAMSDELLIHMTSRTRLEAILAGGLNAVSYWAYEGAVSSYYAETIEDEGQEPVAVRLPLSVLQDHEPEPDYPGLDEPLTHTLGMSEDDIVEAWEDTDQRWQDSLELIQSLRCQKPIPAAVILAHNPDLAAGATAPRRKMSPGR